MQRAADANSWSASNREVMPTSAVTATVTYRYLTLPVEPSHRRDAGELASHSNLRVLRLRVPHHPGRNERCLSSVRARAARPLSAHNVRILTSDSLASICPRPIGCRNHWMGPLASRLPAGTVLNFDGQSHPMGPDANVSAESSVHITPPGASVRSSTAVRGGAFEWQPASCIFLLPLQYHSAPTVSYQTVGSDFRRELLWPASGYVLGRTTTSKICVNTQTAVVSNHKLLLATGFESIPARWRSSSSTPRVGKQTNQVRDDQLVRLDSRPLQKPFQRGDDPAISADARFASPTSTYPRSLRSRASSASRAVHTPFDRVGSARLYPDLQSTYAPMHSRHRAFFIGSSN